MVWMLFILNYVNFYRENCCNFKNIFGIFSHAGARVALLVRVSILHLDVSHMFYIGCYSVPSWHNVVSREEIRWLGVLVCVCVCVCVCARALATTVLLWTWNILLRSEEVTTNTSEAICKLQAQTISSYMCSTSSMASHACIQIQYTHRRLHKAISKPHPQASPPYNTPDIRMDMDCLCSLQHFPFFLLRIMNQKTSLCSLT